MSVAIGYVPGAFGQGGGDPGFLRELVEVGDKHGYDSIWLSDRIVSDRFSLEPMIALSMVAAYSDRMKFGTSVLAMPLRIPSCWPNRSPRWTIFPRAAFFRPWAWVRKSPRNTRPAEFPRKTGAAVPMKPSN